MGNEAVVDRCTHWNAVERCEKGVVGPDVLRSDAQVAKAPRLDRLDGIEQLFPSVHHNLVELRLIFRDVLACSRREFKELRLALHENDGIPVKHQTVAELAARHGTSKFRCAQIALDEGRGSTPEGAM